MEFLKKTLPENRIENIKAFKTKDCLFFRRKVDGIWNCISTDCGIQLIYADNDHPNSKEDSDDRMKENWWKHRLEVFKEGDILEIKF